MTHAKTVVPTGYNPPDSDISKCLFHHYLQWFLFDFFNLLITKNGLKSVGCVTLDEGLLNILFFFMSHLFSLSKLICLHTAAKAFDYSISLL